jgi:uncharacterized protein (DUF1501 family)
MLAGGYSNGPGCNAQFMYVQAHSPFRSGDVSPSAQIAALVVVTLLHYAGPWHAAAAVPR